MIILLTGSGKSKDIVNQLYEYKAFSKGYGKVTTCFFDIHNFNWCTCFHTIRYSSCTLDIFVFIDFSSMTLITPVIAGIPTGYFIHKVLKNKYNDN